MTGGGAAACAADEDAPSHLDLPSELVDLIAYWLMVRDPASALRLRQVCRWFYEVLEGRAATTLRRRLVWVAKASHRRVHARLLSIRKFGFEKGWATGTPLPGSGRFSFHMRVHRGGKGGFLPIVGVSPTALEFHAWGLAISTGRIERWVQENASGHNRRGNMAAGSAPSGWPDYDGKLVLVDEKSQPGISTSAGVAQTIELIIDADAGSMALSVNNGPLLPAIQGFPPGTTFRPWALLFNADDKVELAPVWREVL